MKVCIIGGGFSGTAVAAHLLELGNDSLQITIIERKDVIGVYASFTVSYKVMIPLCIV